MSTLAKYRIYLLVYQIILFAGIVTCNLPLAAFILNMQLFFVSLISLLLLAVDKLTKKVDYITLYGHIDLGRITLRRR
jgi:hypothetical protein